MQQQKFTLPEEKKFIVFGEALEMINRGGTQAISLGYTDSQGMFGEPGAYVEYISSKDSKTGRLIPKRFRFDQSLGRIKTRMNDKDAVGKSQYEFLKNHPSCEGSPYGTYRKGDGGKLYQVGVIFREYDPEKDAKAALDADNLRITAQATALALDDVTMEEIANVLGHFGPVDNAMRVRVIEFAGKRSPEFNELLKSGDRALRALVRKAVKEEVFKKKGSLLMWEETLMGSEDDAITILAKDQSMIDSLKEKLNFNINAEADATPKNKGGRPRKNVEQNNL